MSKYISAIKSLLTLTVFTIFTGCQKSDNTEGNPDVSSEPKAKIALLTGDKQQGIYGDDLPNDLELAISVPAGKTVGQYYIRFGMIQGNGTIADYGHDNPINVAPNGKLRVRWRLGCDNPVQKLKAYVYAYSLSYSTNEITAIPEDSVYVQASGTKPSGWGRSCGCGVPDIYNSNIITHDNKTLYLASRELYSSTDNGINWTKVAGVPKWSEVRGVQFNSKGWMYVLTKNDGIFFSKDLRNWQAINNGILDMRDPTAFMVKDDVLMVSFYFDGPYLTQDNGGFWQKLLVSRNSQRFMFFNQHPDGTLYLFDDWDTFFKSKDMGKTWQSLQLDNNYYSSGPSGFAIGPDGNLFIGSGDATIAQLSPTTLKGTSKRYYEWNGSTQSVSDIQFYNNDVFYLVSSTPKPGIYSLNNGWGRVELDFPKTIVSYFRKSDGGFLLQSHDGLYYRN
ncbi:hypothetical protein GZH53_06770 [Flavihumibacter sp. R14]|nr:hypothetical protein [Flavihumibacter soli]